MHPGIPKILPLSPLYLMRAHVRQCSAVGDALRPLILHAYGGLYLDLDVVRCHQCNLAIIEVI